MLYKNALITTKEEQFLGYLEISSQGKIVKIRRGQTEQTGFDCEQNILMPSFIDSHTHGGYGFSFNDILEKDGQQQFEFYKKNLAKEGVTHVFATTVTDIWKKVKNMAKKYFDLIKNDDTLLTLYLEGPFISKEKKGAQSENAIIPLEEKKLNILREVFPDKKLIIVVAPEVANNQNIIAKYSKSFLFSLGHSNAYDLSKDNFYNSHIKRITHLFNAISMFDHRNESIVNTVFENGRFHNRNAIELISDTKHVSPKVLKLCYELLPKENIVVVSDSLPQKGMEDGFYTLGLLETQKKGDLFFVKGTENLAGSGMPYNKILKAFKKATGASWEEMVYFSSYNAAKNIGLEKQLGIIEENKKANLVLVDKNFNIKLLIKNGKQIK